MMDKKQDKYAEIAAELRIDTTIVRLVAERLAPAKATPKAKVSKPKAKPKVAASKPKVDAKTALETDGIYKNY